MLQCGEPCNPATDAIGSIERWESRKKALLWKGLEVFMNTYIGPGVGHLCMIPACRLMFSNTKKLEQAQKRQKKREVDQCQSQSSSIIPKTKLQLPRGCDQV